MDTTASWRLLPPAASSPPPRRQAALLRRHPAATTTSSSSGKRTTRLLCLLHDTISSPPLRKLAAALQCGAIWAAVEAPAALAPIIMNWMRLRWFKRKFVETYLQFMFTYLFFPGMMLWAPFVNFRKFPRDPTMKYPWSKPKEGTPLFKDRYPPIETYK
uniref:Uncharacterized protein n=1 Tax=Oryza rufipogon TaxID=4529 RepID=A0A0E0PL34_ORYRU